MPRRRYDIFHRWEGDPILVLEDLPFKAADICNAGTIKIDGKYILLLTIEALNGCKRIYLAESKDGYQFEVEKEPFIPPDTSEEYSIYVNQGVFDARISLLEGYYYITYSVLGKHGHVVRLARTKDFKSLERLGLLCEPDTKATCLFPEKIKGKYARLERPEDGGNIWVSYSDDLIHWGWSEVVMTPRGGFWDWHRIGVGTVPIRTDKGWLFIYYGEKNTSAGPLFRLGAAILDINDPVKVVGRSNIPVLSPRMKYERVGDIPNLVFSCGKIVEEDGEVKLYYGASDSCLCVGSTKLQNIIDICMKHEREF
jgi:predicted GH43/DUF377 family glycosyl hydrolase